MRRDDVLALLCQHPTGLSDNELAAQLGVVDQAVNGLCSALAQQGLIIRDRTRSPMVNIIAHDYQPPARIAALKREWFAEGSVRSATVRHLSFAGALITSSSGEIAATLAGRRLRAIVTGYPTASVPDQRRSGEAAPTSPSSLARQLFADALLTGLLLRGRWADDRVALVFPDVPRYSDLRGGATTVLDRVGIEIWLVAEDGTVVTS